MPLISRITMRLSNRSRTWASKLGCLVLSIALSACGGGGGSGGGAVGPTTPPGGSNPPPAGSDFSQGIFSASSTFKDICLAPRSGSFPDTQGSAEDENDWLRAWSNELYLWYAEIDDEDPELYDTPEYFDLMRTFATTPSGADRDQFHFTIDTQEWEQTSQSGISVGYGARVVLISSTPPREAVVAYVEVGSPAGLAGVSRGHKVIEVDGIDLVNATGTTNVDGLNAGLFPDNAGESHTFLVEDLVGAQSSVTITSTEVTQDPVPVANIINTASGQVGYLLFNSHIATAEQRLFDEIQTLAGAGITDLVLDLRYNNGGFLDIANELAFMIAGPAAAGGRVFEEILFNDKHTTTNPVTGAALTPTNFHQVGQGFTVTSGTALPSLNLDRVVILTTDDTCSASESVINGLRGIGIDVVLVGGTTCGKPYGFYPTDNCGTTYFSIQFQGVNALVFGDYADGFVPSQSPVQEYEVQGCVVADDFSLPLGDENEDQLAAALVYLESGACPVGGTSLVATKNVGISDNVSSRALGGSIGRSRTMPGKVHR